MTRRTNMSPAASTPMIGDELARAKARAARLLAQKARSEADLRVRLERSHFSLPVIDAAIAYLRSKGLIDDAQLARETVDSTLRKAPAGDALLLQRVEREGVSQPLAEQAVAQTPRPERARAQAMARLIELRLPRELDAVARWRRALGVMARRGFGEEESMEALREVLGPEPEAPEQPAGGPLF